MAPNRAVSVLYPIECPDEVTSDTEVTDNKLRSGGEADEVSHNMDLNDEESGDAPDDLCAPRTSQPTRKAAITARSKLKLWLDPDDDDILLGSVADHAKN